MKCSALFGENVHFKFISCFIYHSYNSKANNMSQMQLFYAFHMLPQKLCKYPFAPISPTASKLSISKIILTILYRVLIAETDNQLLLRPTANIWQSQKDQANVPYLTCQSDGGWFSLDEVSASSTFHWFDSVYSMTGRVFVFSSFYYFFMFLWFLRLSRLAISFLVYVNILHCMVLCHLSQMFSFAMTAANPGSLTDLCACKVK